MANQPLPKESPYSLCLASKQTKCGQIDPNAPSPWVCLKDWLKGWRVVPEYQGAGKDSVNVGKLIQVRQDMMQFPVAPDHPTYGRCADPVCAYCTDGK